MSTNPPRRAGPMLSAWYPETASSLASPASMSCSLVSGEPKRPLTAHAAAAADAAELPMPEPRGRPCEGEGGRGRTRSKRWWWGGTGDAEELAVLESSQEAHKKKAHALCARWVEGNEKKTTYAIPEWGDGAGGASVNSIYVGTRRGAAGSRMCRVVDTPPHIGPPPHWCVQCTPSGHLREEGTTSSRVPPPDLIQCERNATRRLPNQPERLRGSDADAVILRNQAEAAVIAGDGFDDNFPGGVGNDLGGHGIAITL
eukprot:355040-Chlamydomonas_euryale.AAC.20